MASIRVSLLSTSSALAGTAHIRARIIAAEAVALNHAPMRARSINTEAAVGNVPHMRVRSIAQEAVTGANNPTGLPNLRTRIIVVEALQEILEEVMVSDVFPGIDPATGQPAVLIGLAFDVQKRPTFSNKTATHTSGADTVTSYWQNPRWDYTLQFDYLPDFPKAVGDSDVRTMMGFFLNMKGSFKPFCFQDPDDYIVTQGYQWTFDGVTAQFNLVRGMAGFYEPIGQLNTNQPLSIWREEDESHVIPVTPGPYTVTINHSPTVTPVVKIGATTLVKVSGAPGNNQYSVAGNTYTFNSAQQGQTATWHYQYLVDPATYTYTAPNVILFASAPPAGAIVTASFQYYFVCRFKDDMIEFNKFMNQLWELQQLNFRSIIQ